MTIVRIKIGAKAIYDQDPRRKDHTDIMAVVRDLETAMGIRNHEGKVFEILGPVLSYNVMRLGNFVSDVPENCLEVLKAGPTRNMMIPITKVRFKKGAGEIYARGVYGDLYSVMDGVRIAKRIREMEGKIIEIVGGIQPENCLDLGGIVELVPAKCLEEVPG